MTCKVNLFALPSGSRVEVAGRSQGSCQALHTTRQDRRSLSLIPKTQAEVLDTLAIVRCGCRCSFLLTAHASGMRTCKDVKYHINAISTTGRYSESRVNNLFALLAKSPFEGI